MQMDSGIFGQSICQWTHFSGFLEGKWEFHKVRGLTGQPSFTLSHSLDGSILQYIARVQLSGVWDHITQFYLRSPYPKQTSIFQIFLKRKCGLKFNYNSESLREQQKSGRGSLVQWIRTRILEPATQQKCGFRQFT